MIIKLLSGLLATIMGFFGLGTPAPEAAPAPEQKQVAVAEQGNTDDVQALIDAAHAEAGYEFISVRYEGDTVKHLLADARADFSLPNSPSPLCETPKYDCDDSGQSFRSHFPSWR